MSLPVGHKRQKVEQCRSGRTKVKSCGDFPRRNAFGLFLQKYRRKGSAGQKKVSFGFFGGIWSGGQDQAYLKVWKNGPNGWSDRSAPVNSLHTGVGAGHWRPKEFLSWIFNSYRHMQGPDWQMAWRGGAFLSLPQVSMRSCRQNLYRSSMLLYSHFLLPP